LNLENLQKMDHYFLWGEIQQRDILEHMPGIADKLILTGNPRIDLLRPEFRHYYESVASQLRKKYGPFVLINTNFADTNHFIGPEWVMERDRIAGVITNAQEEAEENAFHEYQARIVSLFKEMIRKISILCPHRKIIIRPHPSENHDTWTSCTRNLKNVSVIHEGDANPWLLAADAIIHNSCTTGIQAFLLDKPVITYMPIRSDQYDYYLPNALSIQATSTNDLLSIIGCIDDGKNSVDLADRSTQMGVAEQYITAINGSFASDRIVDALETLDIEPDTYENKSTYPITTAGFLPVIRGQAIIAQEFIRNLSKRISQVKLTRAEKKQLAYSQQKFPGISFEDIQTRITRLRGINNRFASIQIHQLGNNFFCILPA
jgi:surface carbohydrate biosynthesis protein